MSIDSVISRRSVRRYTSSPVPEQDVDYIVKAGQACNDYGSIKPWKIRTYSGISRTLISNAFWAHDSNNLLEPKDIESVRSRIFSSPLIIVVTFSHKESNKISRDEQLCSAAGCAQLMSTAAHVLGYGCCWKTGRYSKSEIVKSCLNYEPNEEIIAFLHVGKPLNNEIIPSRNLGTSNLVSYR